MEVTKNINLVNVGGKLGFSINFIKCYHFLAKQSARLIFLEMCTQCITQPKHCMGCSSRAGVVHKDSFQIGNISTKWKKYYEIKYLRGRDKVYYFF